MIKRLPKFSFFATRWDQLCGGMCASELPGGSCWSWCLTEILFLFSLPLSLFWCIHTPSPWALPLQYIIFASTLVSRSTYSNCNLRRSLNKKPKLPKYIIQCIISIECYFILKRELEEIFLYSYNYLGRLGNLIFMLLS